ncbi:MAG: Uncharacterised protein [Polaribacter sp. SA4-10]|nr:MAG: Uncharacterised protein [Polaribacter sp. SA4-10]
MIKKLFFILFLFNITANFSQEKPITQLSAAPNPFTTSTKIHFNAVQAGIVIFNVKNILGKTVHKKQLTVQKGKNTISFFKRQLLPGIYIYSIQNKKSIVSKRLVIQ